MVVVVEAWSVMSNVDASKRMERKRKGGREGKKEREQ